MTNTERLTNLHNRATRYEVVLTHVLGNRYLLGYTARVGREGMIRVAQTKGQQILDMVGGDEYGMPKGAGTSCVWHLTNGWTIRFGRTERSAIVEGECCILAA